MMGTLARFLATKQIDTSESNYVAQVEGDIEDVNGVLKITKIRVNYTLKTEQEKQDDVREVMKIYAEKCPAAQSVIGCIEIIDDISFE